MTATDDLGLIGKQLDKLRIRLKILQGVRLVVAQVMDDVTQENRNELRELLGEDAFYDCLDEVIQANAFDHQVQLYKSTT